MYVYIRRVSRRITERGCLRQSSLATVAKISKRTRPVLRFRLSVPSLSLHRDFHSRSLVGSPVFSLRAQLTRLIADSTFYFSEWRYQIDSLCRHCANDIKLKTRSFLNPYLLNFYSNFKDYIDVSTVLQIYSIISATSKRLSRINIDRSRVSRKSLRSRLYGRVVADTRAFLLLRNATASTGERSLAEYGVYVRSRVVLMCITVIYAGVHA